MKTDRVFVLLLVVLLPLSGCFDGSTTGDAEGADAADGSSESTAVINNYYNNTTTSSESQERTWYSSGTVVDTYWNDGQDVASGSQRCLEYGPSYDASTGDYLGEECKETNYPTAISDWNSTTCAASGGVLIGSSSGMLGGDNPRYAPTCSIIATSINTNSGEALILYEMSSISVTTTCGGVDVSSINQIGGYYGGEDNAIVPGSSLSCVHDITYTQTYQKSSYADLNKQSIWSLVYAIQDTTVV